MSLLRLVRQSVVDRLPLGMRLSVERLYYGFGLSQEKRLFRSFCRPDRTALDVGANKGDLTLFLSYYSSHVHVFEPVPSMATRLRHRFRGANVTVHQCAVGAARGQGTLRIPSFGSQIYTTRATLLDDLQDIEVDGAGLSSVREETVQIRPIDDFETGSVGFLKIDVEGFELDVIRGAEKTLRDNRPTLYVEIEQRRHNGRSIDEVFEYVMSLGYSAWFLSSSVMMPLSAFRVETMQATGSEDTDDFVNNFVFLPLELGDGRTGSVPTGLDPEGR